MQHAADLAVTGKESAKKTLDLSYQQHQIMQFLIFAFLTAQLIIPK